MQKHLLSAVWITTLMLGVAGRSFAQTAAPMAPAAAQKLDALFAAWDNTRSPGCAFGVSRNGT